MTGDDDWFERALRDSGDEDGGDEEDGSAGDAEDDPAPGDRAAGTTSGGASDRDPGPDEGGSDEGGPDEGGPDEDGSEDDDLFGDDFASAMEGGTGARGFGGTDGSGSGSAGGSEFGGTGEEGFGGTGEEGFGGTGEEGFGDAGADGSFGTDDGGDFGLGDGETFGFDDEGFGLGGDQEEFAEEATDSELSRVNLGIDGLDQMIRGGVPERSLMTVIGSAGTGKTTFGLQFLDHGLRNDERAIYITLEESRERVLDSATEKGWAFGEYVADDRLAVVDIDPVEMANSLTSIRSELPRLVEEFGAERLVLDSVSLLELMYDDRAKRRNEIYGFTRSLKNAGVTTLLTSEASEDNPYASRHGIVEYLTDAVFVMQYVRPSDFQETRLAIEIQKIRDANHSREMKPYEITDEGLNVYRQANIF